MKINKRITRLFHVQSDVAWALRGFCNNINNNLETAMYYQFEYLFARDEEREALDALTNKDWDDKIDLIHVIRGYPVR